MRFEQPLWLWLLVPVAALVAAYVIAQRRRTQVRRPVRDPADAGAGRADAARLAPARAGGRPSWRR